MSERSEAHSVTVTPSWYTTIGTNNIEFVFGMTT